MTEFNSVNTMPAKPDAESLILDESVAENAGIVAHSGGVIWKFAISEG